MDLQQFLTFPTTSWVRKQQKEGLGNLGIEPAMWIYTAWPDYTLEHRQRQPDLDCHCWFCSQQLRRFLVAYLNRLHIIILYSSRLLSISSGATLLHWLHLKLGSRGVSGWVQEVAVFGHALPTARRTRARPVGGPATRRPAGGIAGLVIQQTWGLNGWSKKTISGLRG
jgi:hypothetical protein